MSTTLQKSVENRSQKSPDAVVADIEANLRYECKSNNSLPDNTTPAIPSDLFLPGTRVFTMHDNKLLQTIVDEVQISLHKENSVVLYWCNVSDQEDGVRRRYFSQEDLFTEFGELLDALTFSIESVGV